MRFFLSIFFFLVALSSPVLAQDHSAHLVKHNMILFGETTIFASHVVYKAPHNFQLILKLNLPVAIMQQVQQATQLYPDETLYLLLDPLDLSAFREVEAINGVVLRENTHGDRVTVIPAIRLGRSDYQVVYYDEVTLF